MKLNWRLKSSTFIVGLLLLGYGIYKDKSDYVKLAIVQILLREKTNLGEKKRVKNE
jgi:Arc/MetJ-type ribon-helix-helix transcriptional regulator